MPTVRLVRHGEVFNPNHVVYGDLAGFDLSAAGVAQAHAAARRLERTGVGLVVTSPLSRAVHTGVAIVETTGARIRVDDRLTEWALFPAWTGMRWDDVASDHGGELAAYLEDPSDLDGVTETLPALADRMEAALRAAVAESSDVTIVSHQDPIRALVLRLTGAPLSDLRSDPPGHCTIIDLSLTPEGSWVEGSRWSPGDR